MVKIERSGKYDKNLDALSRSDPDVIDTVRTAVKLFRKNLKDTHLDNHPLQKTMEGKWAFSITDDVRIVYEWLGKNTVRFLAIGRHAEVYKKSS